MFNTQEDYIKARQGAKIYAVEKESSTNKPLVIFNILLFIMLSYMTIHYFVDKNRTVSPLKTAVLGVSETIDNTDLSNERLMKILANTEVDLIEEDLSNSMNLLIKETSIKSTTSYTEQLAQELDDKSGFRGKIAVANQNK